MEPEPRFVDAEQYQGQGQQEGLSFRQIVLAQLSRCALRQSAEWHGGHYDERVVGNSVARVWVPDTFDEFIHSVQCLHDLLFPYFDPTMTQDAAAFEKIYHEKMTSLEDEFDTQDNNRITVPYARLRREECQTHRILLRNLILLLRRLDFLEGKSYEDS